jgi:ribosomal protein S18 acetylase RimI-like enzyme
VTGPASFRVREAVPADAAALADFGRRTYAAHYASLWSPAALAVYLERHYSRAAIDAHLAAPASIRYLLACDGDELLGFAKANGDRPIPQLAPQRGLELEKVYVAAGRTGRGIGSALIERAVALAEALGEPRVWLDVLKTNAGARRLYERLGFVARAELPFATDRGEIGMLLMTRDVARRDANRRMLDTSREVSR